MGDWMSVWGWIGVGLVAVFAISVLVGLAIARILGAIGDEVSRLLDEEPWASAPLTRENEEQAQTPPQKGVRPFVHGRRTRLPRR